MSGPIPDTIVKTAVHRGDLDKLLLGYPEYRYRPRWSPAPGSTDLTELLAVLYDRWNPAERERIRDDLLHAINSIVGTYGGIDPVAACVLLESLRRARGRPSLGLPLEDVAARLRASISAHSGQLRADRGGGGANWPEGRLDDLRRLSQNTADLGGPAFCD